MKNSTYSQSAMPAASVTQLSTAADKTRCRLQMPSRCRSPAKIACSSAHQNRAAITGGPTSSRPAKVFNTVSSRGWAAPMQSPDSELAGQMPIASLRMYDFPEILGFNEAWWSGLACHFRAAGVEDVPDRLSRDSDHKTPWRSPALCLAQACGYPLTHDFRGVIQVVATL